jgi:hypothetical protein
LVPTARLELAQLSPLPPQDSVSTNFTTSALTAIRELVTAFRSPATAATSRRPPFRGQRSRPATSRPSEWASVPVRPFGSATASRFAPVAAASTPQARCTSTIRFGWPRPPSPLPLGTFASLRIKAFNGVCCLPVRLANSPDFPSLPAALFFFKYGLWINVPDLLLREH